MSTYLKSKTEIIARPLKYYWCHIKPKRGKTSFDTSKCYETVLIAGEYAIFYSPIVYFL